MAALDRELNKQKLPASYREILVKVLINCFKDGIKMYCSNESYRILKFCVTWDPKKFGD